KRAKEEKKAVRDSIIMEKPRILDTYAIPDSMQYKRIIAWTEDRDFGQLNAFVPDTGYNYHFYDDYPFRRKDVNATWLGVNGSPLQYYNWFNRTEDRDAPFYEAQRPWAFDPSTVLQYNSKTPHTELAYYGTLLATDEKESDNLHILTTQNITPEMNFTLAYDRFGGGGMLINESTTNKNFTAVANWLGKKYTMNAGYIYNMVRRGENGGISDNSWIRDTTVDAREIKVNLTTAESKIKKNTFFLDQQLRIPFNFINTLRARRDSTFVIDSTSTDITTAFIGHSSEFSAYSRKYTDKIGSSDTYGRDLYSGIFNLDPSSSADSMRVSVLDNKVYLRLQPWSGDAIVSKLDVGIGDTWKTFYAPTAADTTTVGQNSLYLYAGAQGQYKHYFNWSATGRYDLQGYTAGDMLLEASAKGNFYPFRRARTSPLSIAARVSTSLKAPGYYQNHIYANHYQWDNSFGKTSTTRFEAELDIPHWKLKAKAGYALLSGNIWYDSLGVVRQNTAPMSVLGISVKKDFTIADFLHLDNRILFQYSSDQDVLPLPTLALNLRYYAQFVVQRDASKTSNVMVMQIGADALWNTAWHTPGWNPNLGVFHNQSRIMYNNGPVFDAFINIQWKRACIFVKYENAGQGWPLEKADYFTADHYAYTQRSVRLGLFWPFYIQSGRNDSVGGHSH
ncbi:MAG: putative porin, partial [Bacteroidales bacterium]|nr:putative porin [Bacteroidales bacterium]